MKYSIHDGPGIRTAVFLKGCPLTCWWCHNPESQSPKPELMLRGDRCIACLACVDACPHGAIVLQDGAVATLGARCQACLTCVSVCHADARAAAGRSVSVEQVMAEIMKDAVFYEESGGGVTFSGGEPLMQADFLYSLLVECKKRETHTAVDTTGLCRQEDLLRVSAVADLFLYDLKLMDDGEHRKYTGVSNRTILENLRELAVQRRGRPGGGNVIIRVPIIPGVNDQPENLRATGQYVAGLGGGIREVDLLPYHKAGVDKYRRLGKPYLLPDCEPPDSETMERLAGIVRETGCHVKIGG